MQHYDYMIVGQGLAGTVMAFRLLEAGKTVVVIDNAHQSAASKVAAGIINPVTGRRLVKSWRIDDLIPAAKVFYQGLEKQLNTKFFYEVDIQRALLDYGDENQWTVRLGYSEYQNYLSPINKPSSNGIIPPLSIGNIQNAFRVDLPLFIKTAKKNLEEQQLIIKEAFKHHLLSVEDENISYGDISANHIIFSEGHQITQNPYFQNIPMVLAKGEVLLIKAPNLDLDQMYKRKLTYVPLGNQIFWVGATYEWKYEDDLPSPKGKTELLSKIEQDLDTSFEIIDHQAAIRPTIKDRRPVLGTHATHSNIHIFNGLGTKGTSIAPYWSKEMLGHLLSGTRLDKEVSIERFI